MGITLHLATILPAGLLVVLQVRYFPFFQRGHFVADVPTCTVHSIHTPEVPDDSPNMRICRNHPPPSLERRCPYDNTPLVWWRVGDPNSARVVGGFDYGVRVHGLLQYQETTG